MRCLPPATCLSAWAKRPSRRGARSRRKSTRSSPGSERISARHWASEVDVAFSRQPVSCFIAVRQKSILGFACHDATCPNFFGPTGVDPNERKNGIGKALLFNCLEAMKQQGYGYAIIGGVGPAEFYAKTVGAIPIEGSEPGVYRGLL